MLKKSLLSLLVFVLFLVSVLSSEVVASTEGISQIFFVDGTLLNGQSLTITGKNFGTSGPVLQVFEDFDDLGNPAGGEPDLNATVGEWSGYSSSYWDTQYNSISRSGSYSGELSGIKNIGTPTHAYHAGFFIDFPASTEYFLSYAVQIPKGTYFPHIDSDAVGPNAFPSGSNWKFAWIRDYENDPDASPGDDDKCLPTYTSTKLIRTDGNDLNASNGSSSIRIYDDTAGGPGDTWWQWGSWNRFAFWGKADATNPSTVSGNEWAQGIGEGVEQISRTNTTDPLFASGHAPYQWTRLHINGWIRETEIADPIELLYDDIYFAVGPNAAARVEIGNNPVYSKCTKLAIATPESWDDTTISIRVREGGFSANEIVYLFVINSNNIPSVGYGPLTFGNDANKFPTLLPPSLKPPITN